jgi:NADH-quinone oxidoreductase subunit G
VVLPALSFAERDGTYTSADRRVQRAERALPPFGQGRPDWAIFADVAARLGANWQFHSAQEVLMAINKEVTLYENMTMAELRASEPQWPPVGHDSLYYAGTAYQNDGGLGLRWPVKAEEEVAALSFERVEPPPIANDDFVAVPVRKLMRQGTLVKQSRVLDQRLCPPEAEFNPEDGGRLNLESGATVRLGFSARTAKLTARLNARVPEGVVLVPHNLPAGPVSVWIEADVEFNGET